MRAKVEDLLGKTLVKIDNNQNDELIFHTSEGEMYKMYHDPDCCESVNIDDICGDLEDLIGNPLLQSEEFSDDDFQNEYESKFTEQGESWGTKRDKDGNYYPESHTWTFYKFATIRGYVTVRWFGESNGYYSESVDFVKADSGGNFSRW